MPLPELRYAQVIKTTRRWRLVRVSHRLVFGTFEAGQQVLAACGWQIHTAFVERLNLTIRQPVAAIGRRVPPYARAKRAGPATGLVPRLRQLLPAPWECTPATAPAGSDPRDGLGQAVATVATATNSLQPGAG